VTAGLEDSVHRPSVVGIGGSARPGSTTDRALQIALAAAEQDGARTSMFGGAFLTRLPLYIPGSSDRTDEAQELVTAVRLADGVLLASPGYHGGVSGLVKNAVDFLEDLRDDNRPYLEGRAVGCIVTACGWQACTTTLVALRSVVHALRGWPTPCGATLNTAERVFDSAGRCIDQKAAMQLDLVARQVLGFASLHSRVPMGVAAAS
jgi:FMN reductase